MCSNVVNLTAVTAGAAAAGADALVSPSQVSHDTPPIYEQCGLPSSSSSLAPVIAAAPAADRPVPRPRSTYGKYYLENLKNINAESKPSGATSPVDDSDNDNDDAFSR